MASAALPRLPVFEAIAGHDPRRTVVVHSASGRRFRYGELLGHVRRARDRLYEATGRADLDGERVAFLIENSYDYVVALLAIMAAKAIAVPLSPAFPVPELQYVLNNSAAMLLLSSARFAPKVDEVLQAGLDVKPTVLQLAKFPGGGAHEKVALAERLDAGGAGMMLYTSGTTNRPKGVLLSQDVMTAQARALLQAWEYSPADHLLHVLPLHHIHGTINAVFTPLFSGSAIEFLFPFSAEAVLRRFAAPFLAHPDQLPDTNSDHHSTTPAALATTATGDSQTATTQTPPLHPPYKKITLFTAVPTVYSRLLTTHADHLAPDVASAARAAVSPAHLRLAISGSAALPAPVRRAWADLSSNGSSGSNGGGGSGGGAFLLERYGMTEVSMALSCGLEPADRAEGSVGWPLPGVEVRLVDVDTGTVITPQDEAAARAAGTERPGEIHLRGDSVFRGYWRNPDATRKEFVLLDDDKDAPADGQTITTPPTTPPTTTIATTSRAAVGADGVPARDAWFKTGDMAVRRPVGGAGRSARASQRGWAAGADMFFMLGRRSADIIKSGGEKVSALEVEREMLALPAVAEVGVVAVPSGRWGQKVGAVVVLRQPPPSSAAAGAGEMGKEREGEKERRAGGSKANGQTQAPQQRARPRWSAMDMRRALKGSLAAYKIPQVLRVVDHIPRNAMGKINKKELVQAVFKEEFSGDEM